MSGKINFKSNIKFPAHFSFAISIIIIRCIFPFTIPPSPFYTTSMDYKPCELKEHFDDMEISLIHQVENEINHLESTASAFWQTYLHRSFPRPWQLLCEQGPDESMRRVDMKVIYYNSESGNLSPVLLVEVKRKKGSMSEVQDQGLDAAVKAIDSLNLTGMFVITAIGLKYRAWYVSRQDQELQPLHGSIEKATWEYLHVTQQSGILNLEETIRLIKGEPPMRQARVVPSQHTELENLLQAEESCAPEGYSVNQAGLAEDIQGGETTYYHPTTYYQQPPEETETQGSAPRGVEEEAESTKEKRIVNVKVKLKTHRFGENEYEFRDIYNNKRTTKRRDWKEKREGNITYFEYKGKTYRYRCEELPR